MLEYGTLAVEFIIVFVYRISDMLGKSARSDNDTVLLSRDR